MVQDPRATCARLDQDLQQVDPGGSPEGTRRALLAAMALAVVASPGSHERVHGVSQALDPTGLDLHSDELPSALEHQVDLAEARLQTAMKDAPAFGAEVACGQLFTEPPELGVRSPRAACEPGGKEPPPSSPQEAG
jgi:hypothetical protein